MHGFANLATAFQITGIKTITGLRVERRTLGQRLHNEGAQILVRLALQDGALLLRHPEPAEQNTGLYIYKGLDFTAGLYGLYTIIAIFGYFKWRKMMNKDEGLEIRD